MREAAKELKLKVYYRGMVMHPLVLMNAKNCLLYTSDAADE